MLCVENREIGILGEVHPKHIEGVFFAELHLEDLRSVAGNIEKMQPLPHYPASQRDVTVTVPNEVSVQLLFDAVHGQSSAYLESVSLIAVYSDEKLGCGIKNMTFRFIYRSGERTLSMDEVEREHTKLVNQLRSRL